MKHICAMKKYLIDDLDEVCEYHLKKDDMDMHDLKHITAEAEAIEALHDIHDIIHDVEMEHKAAEHKEHKEHKDHKDRGPRRHYTYD